MDAGFGLRARLGVGTESRAACGNDSGSENGQARTVGEPYDDALAAGCDVDDAFGVHLAACMDDSAAATRSAVSAGIPSELARLPPSADSSSPWSAPGV